MIINSLNHLLKTRPLSLSIALTVILLLTAPTAFCAMGNGNLSSGKKAKFSPASNYRLTTDSNDPYQLTDGKLANEHSKMWVQKKSTVGWSSKTRITITIDLGKDQPISGVSIHSGAGLAHVRWPAIVQLMLSTDGETYHALDNLVKSPPRPDGYESRWFKTDSLKTHGRYVKLVIYPGYRHFFTDEIQVHKGNPKWLNKPLPGPGAQEKDELILLGYAHRRFSTDIAKVYRLISTSLLSKSKQSQLLSSLASLKQKAERHTSIKEALPSDNNVKLPLNKLDSQVLKIWGQFLEKSGAKSLIVRPVNPWGFSEWISNPATKNNRQKAVNVYAMRGEQRPAAVNLTNATGKPMHIKFSIPGLSKKAGLSGVYKVQWTDTVKSIPVASALIPLKAKKSEYKLTIPAGVTQQVWFKFKPIASGQFTGKIVVKKNNGSKSITPLQVNVFNLDYPKKQQIHVGGWDYTDRYARGVSSENRKQLIDMLQQYNVNRTWGSGWSTLPFGKYDKEGEMTQKPDMARFDKWIKLWPNAKQYAVYVSAKNKIENLSIGTPAFKKAVGKWSHFIANYAKSKGVQPKQILLLLVDEPQSSSDYKRSIAWASAIKSAHTGLTTWTDPIGRNPEKIPDKFIDSFDTFCFNRYYLMVEPNKYKKLISRIHSFGKTLEVYGTKGPAMIQGPYAYYRLSAWVAWQMGADATSFWSFTDNGGTSSWMPYFNNHTSGPFTPLFLDKEKAIASKQMAGISVGVEDYQYLYMLKNTIKHAKEYNLSSKQIKQGKFLLKSSVKRVLNAPGIDGKYYNLEWNIPKNRKVADQMRIKIGKWLEQNNTQ